MKGSNVKELSIAQMIEKAGTSRSENAEFTKTMLELLQFVMETLFPEGKISIQGGEYLVVKVHTDKQLDTDSLMTVGEIAKQFKEKGMQVALKRSGHGVTLLFQLAKLPETPSESTL